MDKILDVYLHDRRAGHYSQNKDRLNEFTYAPEYLAMQDAMPLSHSLPLRKETFRASACRGFFAGLLPEGEKRETIARNLGISPRNDFSMLDRIGGECAGAITFLPPGQPLQQEANEYKLISEPELENILEELPNRPLLAGQQGIRLSLAGAQDKLSVYVSGNQIKLPLGNAPSTHIIKPDISKFAGVVYNEALCMTLAKKLGLPVADVEIRTSGKKKFLLVGRYDRIPNENPADPVQRIHQEDFCQALGIVPEKKYEDEGGVSIKDCFDLLREVSSTPLIDLRHMLDAVIFNFIIGNHDAHGKNFSLLYDRTNQRKSVRLAPLYDLVCTTVYPQLSTNMAMKIGGKYKSDHIQPSHFDKMAEETGLAKPLVRERVKMIAMRIVDILQQPDAFQEKVANEIEKRALRTAREFDL